MINNNNFARFDGDCRCVFESKGQCKCSSMRLMNVVKIHLLLAHPEKTSFNATLHRTALDVLQKYGVIHSISDLYVNKFTPLQVNLTY